MKRAPFTYGVENPNPGQFAGEGNSDQDGKRYFRSADEYARTPQFREALDREFPDGASEMNDEPSRREFVQVMGASLALAGLAGCRRPEEKIVAYGHAPEEVIPGKPLFYATAFPFQGTAYGLMVESHGGRPTKIEGNPKHPESLGAAGIYAQAEVLNLYDPDRSAAPQNKGQASSWEAALAAVRAAGAATRARQGAGLAILAEEHRSPSLQWQLEELKKQLPNAQIVRYQAFSRAHVREGLKLAFGRPLEAVVDTKAAEVLVTLDADLFAVDGGTIRQARGFADGRRLAEGEKGMNRLYAVESAFTITGAAADHRLRLKSRDVTAFALSLCKALGVDIGAAAPKKPARPDFDKWVSAVAKDLQAHRGTSLLVAGQKQPAEVHAAVALANFALGNAGKTVKYVRTFLGGSPASTDVEGPAALKELCDKARAGQIDTLIVLGGNPAYDAPADADFAGAIAKVATSIHVALSVDETSALSTWHLPRAHFLESWGDVRAEDGTASIVQPLIAPLLGGRTDGEILEQLLGGTRSAHELVKQAWQLPAGPGGGALAQEPKWRRALHDGVIEGTNWPIEAVSAAAGAAAAIGALKDSPANEWEITFQPDAHAWDGRYANNGWLQEMPDPMSKLTWDNAAVISPAAAAKLGVVDGDVIQINAGLKPVSIAVRVMPGHPDDSIGLTIGQGRKQVGRVGTGHGFDVGPLRTLAAFYAGAANVTKTSETYKLAQTQEHHTMEGRAIVREASLTRYLKNPEFAEEMVEHPPLLNMWTDHAQNGHKWGMVIDLNACIGCNGCMVSCQSENNIPLVGKIGVMKSREMHWIRLDRYFGTHGDINAASTEDFAGMGDVDAVMQPMACQQCENAPCEQVCPVGATTHSPEGLNDMAYNRCIGTRYCANNCPFKVRRFNFFNYQNNFEEVGALRKMQYNPDVTVRARGVMEKCTYCVQRINEAKIAAKVSGREIQDGEFTTACAQGCPTSAITFGDLANPESAVSKAAKEERQYKLLEEINVRPRTSYLARVRNLNPELG